jgi:hypothetical protein
MAFGHMMVALIVLSTISSLVLGALWDTCGRFPKKLRDLSYLCWQRADEPARLWMLIATRLLGAAVFASMNTLMGLEKAVPAAWNCCLQWCWTGS